MYQPLLKHSLCPAEPNYHQHPLTHSLAPSHPYFLLPPATTVQLLHKLKVRSADGKATLLKVIKNPITRHLPAGCKCYGFSVQGTLYNPSSLACALPEDKPVVFVLGAMAAGHITVNDHPYVRGGKGGWREVAAEEEEGHDGRVGWAEVKQAVSFISASCVFLHFLIG